MSVGGIVQRRVEAVKSMLAIPPISESMAGVIILYVFTNSVATSIWMFNAWSPFVYTLFGGSNFYVGLMAAVNGVFELTAAMASGHIADKVMGPSRMLQFAVRFGLFTLSVVLIAIWSKRASFLVFAQCCEGTYMGLSFTCLESVFAQCLRRGERDRLYSIKFSFEAAGPIAGLLLSIVLYSVVGDAWDIGILRCVMTAGLVLHLCSLTTFLCTFKPLPWVGHDGNAAEEDKTGAADGGVGEEATDVAVCPAAPAGVEHLCDREDSRLEVDVVELELPPSTMPGPTTEVANRARCAIVQSAGAAPIPASRYEPSVCTALEATEDGHLRNATFFTAPPSSEGEEEEEEERKKAKPTQQGPAAPNADKGCYVDLELEKARGCRRKMMICIPLRWYPVIVALADAILIFGSGMTTQYFTLFMMNVYDVGPVSMAFLNLANSCLISFLAISCGYMGRRYGRVRALLPPKLTGSFILLWMALARGTSYAPKFLMCIAYVLRNALMNCSAGLSRALIMDLVPEGQRGRWNAIESVQSAGWSGTALFGGFLADHLGYGAAFIFTFFFHITACTLLLPLTVRNDARLPQLIASPPKVVESAQSGSSTSVHGDGDDNAIVVELTEENIKTCIVRTETTS